MSVLTADLAPDLTSAESRVPPNDVLRRIRLAERQLAPLPAWRVHAIRLAGVAMIVFGVLYLSWRTTTIAGTGALGASFLVVELSSFASLVATVALTWRVSHRRRPQGTPSGTLDIFIPVYDEPVAMVEATLRAALAITYPHRTYILNDGRMNKASSWRDIEELARRYGVTSFARGDGRRSKAGNMNHALKRTCGDFVAVIDADHQARPDFADQVLGYFADPRVGFVATPQALETDATDGLYNRETFFYRSIQRSKDASNAAFSCGNAALYRRVALDSIGGFSEWNIVEDLHTSMRLHSARWRSVYHPVPLTIGTAPSTAAEWAIQRQRWAADSMRILFRDNPLLKSGLKPIQRLHYLHTTSYFFSSAVQSFAMLTPALYLLFNVSVMRFNSIGSYLEHTLPYLGCLALYLMLHCGVRGALRSVQSVSMANAISGFGLVQALFGVKFGRHVTRKEREARVSILLLPHYITVVLSVVGVAAALTDRRDNLELAGVWAAWTVVALAGLATLPQRRRAFRQVYRTAMFSSAAVAVFVLMGAPSTELFPRALAWEKDRPGYDMLDTARLAGAARLVPPSDGVYFGTYSSKPLRESGRGTADGMRPSIQHWYQHWVNDDESFPDFPVDDARLVAANGAIPMITWEPWAKPTGVVHGPDQPAFSLREIASGAYDTYIKQWAKEAAAYRGPLLLRFMHEMNGNWYPWSVVANGNTSADFVAAWRHVHDIFSRAGATNVSWVWTLHSFNAGTEDQQDPAAYYPGDEYVDWTSATAFNWGTSYRWNTWRSFADIFGPTYDALLAFGKPVMVSEVSTVAVGGDPVVWLDDALRSLRERFTAVNALVWFDDSYPGGVDFRLSKAARTALTAEFGIYRRGRSPEFKLVEADPARSAGGTPALRPASSLPASRVPSGR